MPIKRTISGRIGKGSIGHDNRLFIAKNVDASRTDRNIVLVREDIEQVYHELFDKPLEKYNARQKRKDRRIKNYYEHIRRSKQEKPFYEVIFQIGNNEDTRCGTPEAELTTKALTEFVQSFQKRNPQLRVFNAVIHLDEETPHVHLDFIPFATGQKRGLSTRNTLTGALEQQGYKGEGKLNTCSKLWIDSEKQALADIMGSYGIEWQQLDTHEQHLDVLDYKKKMRTREVAVLENKVQTTNSIIERRQQVLNSADEVIDRLDREYAEKTDMVEQLDNTIAEKTAELRAVEEKLTADQQMIQVSAEKVTALLEIDTIEVKRKALGDKVTLSADDYEKVAVLAKKQIATENDKTEMADAVERLTEENDELLQNVAKLRELNKTLASEKTALQKAVDRLEKSLRSVQEEIGYWKWKFNKAMEFLERHSLKRKWEEWGGKRNRGR